MTKPKNALEPRKKIGRPKGSGLLYTEEIAEEICRRLGNGETLVGICRRDENGEDREPRTFPSFSCVHNWADPKDKACIPAFVPRFARARLDQQKFLLDEIVELARSREIALEETVEEEFGLDAEGNEIVVGKKRKRTRKDEIRRTNVRIQTNINYLSRINPQLWESRLQAPAPIERTEQEQPKLVIEGGLPDDEPIPPKQEGDDDATSENGS